jgi:hypothetical protein
MARTDISDEDKLDDLQDFETIVLHKRQQRMREFFGIGALPGGAS